MNRLHHLRQTIFQNLFDNADYENLEFVILDYNSKDGTMEWVRNHLGDLITSGRVSYFRTEEPVKWNPSHSKNIAFKLAVGDVVCNIWADYFTGSGFANYVNTVFSSQNDSVLTPIDFHRTKPDFRPPGDVLGKVCVRKKDFQKIRGFDERMDKHGFEDYDFVNRLELMGIKRVIMNEPEYLRFIEHEDAERFSLPVGQIHEFFVNYISPSASSVFFLFKNNTFQQGILIDNYSVDSEDPAYAFKRRQTYFEFSIRHPGWVTGYWTELNKCYQFKSADDSMFILEKNDDYLLDVKRKCKYFKISDRTVIDSVLLFDHYSYTRKLMEDNLNKRTVTVNSPNFGKATVFKNFSDQPIYI